VDYLLMAKLDAIRTLENPPWPGERMYVPLSPVAR
jgi:hypothetical protein